VPPGSVPTYPTLHGAYAERVRVKARRLVSIGYDISDVSAASGYDEIEDT
jgi:NADPH:quinone reductase-like Zn-dependent oxidoreductase